MSDSEKMAIIIDKIKVIAAGKCVSDNEHFCSIDCGSYDDAFSDGKSDGRIFFARELLEMLK